MIPTHELGRLNDGGLSGGKHNFPIAEFSDGHGYSSRQGGGWGNRCSPLPKHEKSSGLTGNCYKDRGKAGEKTMGFEWW
jgi:hypothetical protein